MANKERTEKTDYCRGIKMDGSYYSWLHDAIHKSFIHSFTTIQKHKNINVCWTGNTTQRPMALKGSVSLTRTLPYFAQSTWKHVLCAHSLPHHWWFSSYNLKYCYIKFKHDLQFCVRSTLNMTNYTFLLHCPSLTEQLCSKRLCLSNSSMSSSFMSPACCPLGIMSSS